MREGQAGRQANRDTERQRETRHRGRERERQRETDRQTDRQTETDRQRLRNLFLCVYTRGTSVSSLNRRTFYRVCSAQLKFNSGDSWQAQRQASML